jgi:glucose-1-phosphate thymidylyltransferase
MIEKIDSIDYIYTVTNYRFYLQFIGWVENYRNKTSKDIKVLNDLTTSNENMLGDIADIKFAIDSEEIKSDILVMAGDNLFDFELMGFESLRYPSKEIHQTPRTFICTNRF